MPGIVDQSDSANDPILFVDHCVKGRPSGSVAQLQSARTASERPWVQVPVGQGFFPPL